MKAKIILIIVFCFIFSFFTAYLNASSAPLCIINGLILYQLWKINEHLSNKKDS